MCQSNKPVKPLTIENWLAIKRTLDSETYRARFAARVEETFQTRCCVNIRRLTENTRKVLGEQYAVWVNEILTTAASRTNIEVLNA